MKNVFIAICALAMSACTSAQQQKVEHVVEVIECKAAVLAPYYVYFTDEAFFEALTNENYVEILEFAGLAPSEIKATVEALKACVEN